MATFILDTDTLSLFQRNHPKILAAVGGHSTDLLAVCTVTLEEQIGGWSGLARTARTPQQHEHAAMFLAALIVSWNRFAVVPLTVPAMTRSVHRHEQARRGEEVAGRTGEVPESRLAEEEEVTRLVIQCRGRSSPCHYAIIFVPP